MRTKASPAGVGQVEVPGYERLLGSKVMNRGWISPPMREIMYAVCVPALWGVRAECNIIWYVWMA